MNEPTPLESAVAKLGGQSATATLLQVTQGLVSQWVRGIRPLAPQHCPAIEAATGIRCEQLRPDIVWTRDTGGVVTGYHTPLPLTA